MIDTHCHLDLPIFKEDLSSVLQSAKDVGISDIIIPSISAGHWNGVKKLFQLSSQPKLHVAYGLHPMFTEEHSNSDIGALERWIQLEAPVAVGECGLDFFIQDFDKNKQLALFEAQVKLSCEYDLPLIIHSRKSLDLILKIIRKVK